MTSSTPTPMRRRAAARRLARVAALGGLGLCVVACREPEPPPKGDGGDVGGDTADEPESTSTGVVFEPSNEATDLCDQAPPIGAGTHRGSLRGHSSELDGACGRGGPDAFFRLEVPRRSDVQLRGKGAGFVPRVGVLPNTCSATWVSRTLLCDEGEGTWLLDVAEGSSLVVSIGIDPDDPLLGLPPPELGPDPLEFELDVKLRNVLDEGDRCEPRDRGRCGSGTACLPVPPPPDDPTAPPGPAVCTVIPGDGCSAPVELPLSPGITTVEIDPSVPYTDAHVHSCGGARRPDVVLALRLPPGPHVLDVRADRPELGLALRSPGCQSADERACAFGDELDGPVLSAALDEAEALLFVELPVATSQDDGGSDDGGSTDGGSTGDGPGEEAPILVELTVTEAGS